MQNQMRILYVKNSMTDIIEEEICIVPDNDNPTGNCGYNYNVKFISLDGYDICWTKEQAEALKQQILNWKEKSEKYDEIKDESLILNPELLEENQKLKEKLNEIQKTIVVRIDQYAEHLRFNRNDVEYYRVLYKKEALDSLNEKVREILKELES